MSQRVFARFPRFENVFASRARGLQMSGIRKMFELAASDAINLGLGEPDFQPPENVIQAFQKAVAKALLDLV